MAFFQVDDDFPTNHKIERMIEDESAARAAPAIMLWVLAGASSRKQGTDGATTAKRATRLMGGDAALARAAAKLLVKHGLWHAPKHGCEKCPDTPAASWVFHDWKQFGYAPGASERIQKDKQKELRRPEIVEAVWARDTDAHGVARCRYCSMRVEKPARGSHGGKRRGDAVGQLDHVDPTKAIGPTNIVVACPDCNRTKGQRTPEQAGMTLKPPPQRADVPAGQGASDQVNDQVAIKTGSSSEVSPTRARPRAGAGGVLVGSGLGSPGVAGAAPVVPVPARFGPSVWQGHHGPPPDPDLIAQATCPDHGHPRPCRTCAAAPYEAAASTPAPRRTRRGSRGRRRSTEETL
ncbi:HNH endonuclease [Sanguibacter sp. HDW7]|uniref:HNH endonuclease n=1 Tax=Sanguibacter sp. HDW7 TaxID=2714931 RepID=UPI001407F8FE|nr:HNH endonuclease [Sanguibacter sp. HDW7]QIK83097.1 HNH endonuclease [Sanguibacter sp. HDW7]